MKPCLHVLALVLTGAACCTPASSQTIYRCGAAYSQQPCPDATTLDVSDPRTPAQKAQTDAATAGAAKMAAQMEKDRLQREKSLLAKSPKKPAPRVKLATTGSSTAAPKTRAKKKKDPEYFTAVAAEKKGKKAGKSSGDPAPVAVTEKTDQPVKP